MTKEIHEFTLETLYCSKNICVGRYFFSLLSKVESTENHIFKINLKIPNLVDTHENISKMILQNIK